MPRGGSSYSGSSSRNICSPVECGDVFKQLKRKLWQQKQWSRRKEEIIHEQIEEKKRMEVVDKQQEGKQNDENET
jgi:hypothetical protein